MNLPEDQEPAKSALTRGFAETTASICMSVVQESGRALGAILITWPRSEFYKPWKDQDLRVRLD